MLDLSKQDEVFRKIIFDSATGQEVELLHRLPTTQEEGGFQRKNLRRRDRPSHFPADPTSTNCYPEWKNLLREKAPRILSALAVGVFEGGRVQTPEEEEGDGEDPYAGI